MRKTLLVSSLLLTLTACGGGGAGTPTATQTSAAQTPATGGGPALANTKISGSVTMLTPVPAAATGFTESGDPVADAMTFVNYQRAQVGLPAVTNNASIANAAHNHSVYLYDNNETGHNETSGRTGYTGATSYARITAAYPGSGGNTGEILTTFQGISQFPSSSLPIRILFEAPFHRAVSLFNFASAGAGAVSSGSTSNVLSLTMDFGGVQSGGLGATQMLVSPYNGQADVETSWYANESPSPFQASPAYQNTTVGYPVLITGGLGSSLTVSSFTLQTAAGVSVPCQEMDESVNSEVQGMATCTPFAQLAPSTSYIATATGTMTKNGTTQSFGLQWEFTTASSTTVPYDSPSRL